MDILIKLHNSQARLLCCYSSIVTLKLLHNIFSRVFYALLLYVHTYTLTYLKLKLKVIFYVLAVKMSKKFLISISSGIISCLYCFDFSIKSTELGTQAKISMLSK